MILHLSLSSKCAFVATLTMLTVAAASRADEKGWIQLIGPKPDLSVWKSPTEKWQSVADVTLTPDNPRRLVGKPGESVLFNGPTGRANDLLSKQEFGDLEVHVEFLIAKGSNSGVKLQGLYEIQILDSFGKKKLTGDDCGGIYPRAELKPKYHHIDNGTPPRVNAAKPAGEWQTLDITFRAPRFDGAGKKTANARFLKVILNGQVVHDNVELQWPTGHNWTTKEIARGRLLLQGDHGPVAFRNVRVRPLNQDVRKD